ncbi:FAD-dependent oxidoreductase [Mycobacterium sp. CVI_P3]|uniref:FAD-dependent oxidoreductase n=1 Tax=Mycobacterium pinniadriaticum TaxID=2994102 RepID=A0ABT3SHJ0_9MYCO|nr:FAD-dependent oxidoreductase [Mycobacterium pinniadriaticum]MCX2932277.1 FAD-dependent oxidoreductase [Mycobacterium pinniadriaticum]MCX2938623.1 FAD-dependent oxidoreductase [Mycobacterium pinniadriaticum]
MTAYDAGREVQLTVDVLVIGAGATGLSATYACVNSGVSVAVVERTATVGGLAKAAKVAGHNIDPGGHRLLSATEEQRRTWLDLSERLGGIPICDVNRRSGILRDGYVVTYPVDWRRFRQSAPWHVRAQGAASLLMRKLTFPASGPDTSLAEWVRNRYGPYFAGRFMDPHARKVFGVDPRKIPATWAHNRIASPPMLSVLAAALPNWRPMSEPDWAIDEFWYPVGGVGVLWTRLSEVIGERARWYFESHVKSVSRQPGGGFRVVLSTPAGKIAVSCRRVISTGRADDLASSIGLNALSATISSKSRRRDLVVGVARVHRMPRAWHGYQWLYTHDTGVIASRFQNYGEWQWLGCPDGIIGLEYTIDSGDAFDVQENLTNDTSILLSGDACEFVGSATVTDAYSNFDATRPELDQLDEALREFGGGIISTGRQGAGIYVNLDQALALGTRAAQMPADYSGIVGRGEYTKYQERVSRAKAS